MLIEVHIIQNHAPSNLNRDDSGSPKSAIFGGYRRARLSSQCLKRCYRTSQTFRDEVDSDLGMHTRSMPDEVLRRANVDLTDEERVAKLKLLRDAVKDNDSASTDSDDGYKTSQSVFWRETELNALAEGLKANPTDFDPKVILEPAGKAPLGVPVDMALFGRMVTSKLLQNVEASSQFAHAISTHEWAREFDLWTRVDDRRDKGLDFYKSAFGADEKLEAGTDGMGDAEFTSACYYSYFNVNFEALVDNLTGKALKHDLDDSADREKAKVRACAAVAGLVKAAIFERPTGKFNSMATPSLPTLVLVEVRESHVPVSYANAFAKPVDPKNEETQNEHGQIQRVDLCTESARRLIEEANRITKGFSRDAKARLAFTGGQHVGAALDNDQVPAGEPDTVDDLIKGLKAAIGCPADSSHG